MWKFIFDSVQGTSHKASGLPCQDACRVSAISFDEGHALLIACADGAGSALHSDKSAALVCDRFVGFFNENPPQDIVRSSIGFSVGEYLCNHLRTGVESLASELAIELRDLACTFLGAVILDSVATFLQIGDGAIVIRGEDGYEPVFWPQSGEYLNTTNFLTDDNFLDKFAIEIVDGRIEEVAVFTDGIERLALRTVDQSAHGPFFRPMFEALRASADASVLSNPLRLFLDSDAVNERTDDDKTLVLAIRCGLAPNHDAPVL